VVLTGRRRQLQRVEYKLLCLAVQEATRLAGAGDTAAGYECLLAGLYRVCELARAGEDWAAALTADYRLALLCYARIYPSPRPLGAEGPVRAPARHAVLNPRYQPASRRRRSVPVPRPI
jgi:hypothetical protein